LRQRCRYELLFSPICGCFGMIPIAHNGLVPGSSPGGPTNEFNDLAAILRISRKSDEPNAAGIPVALGSLAQLFMEKR
jgi:hypothetical protein